MKVKKTLENRIRGWFPQEPYLLNTQVKVECEVKIKTKQPPFMIRQDYTGSATKIALTVAILWILIYCFTSLIVFSLQPNNITLLVAWAIVGVVVGVFSGKKYTQNQLQRLLKEVEIYLNKKDMILAIVPMLIMLSFSYLVNWFLFDALTRHSILLGALVSVYAFSISQQVTRFTLFRGFEKKTGMQLMQSWFESGIAVIPKAPNNNQNAGNSQ